MGKEAVNDSQIQLVGKQSVGEAKHNKIEIESPTKSFTRRKDRKLIKQGSGAGSSAKQMCSQFCARNKKDIDAEKMKKVNKLLRGLLCE